MACFHPIRAWRTNGGAVQLNRPAPDAAPLHLPCGGCLGCRTAAAKAWALRCQLELQQHNSAVFSTLTYDDAHLPPTLSTREVTLWLKRLRKSLGPARPIRFFASGEYGEQTHRPHYHAILYGATTTDAGKIEKSWGLGHVQTETVTPARIAYVAGYTSKKIGYKYKIRDLVDPETGEYLGKWQPPFIQMSRQPGIGGNAREHTQSWREYAIHNGQHMPVPKYYHEAWKALATTEQLEDLDRDQQQKQIAKQPVTYEQLAAAEKIAMSQQSIKAATRKY